MRIATAALASVALGLTAARGAVAQSPVDTAVRTAEARRFAAMMRADTTELGRYLAEELAYTHSNALFETRAAHLDAIASKRTIYESIAPVEMAYRLFGDAVVGTGTVKSKGSIGGTAFDVTLRVTTVHLRRGGKWLLVAWQSTRVP